ncbi:MAG: alternative ribosome rescue aminoacyl-tRNA hydrolase ArfB, partial [Gammaproteobacteria bacterium]
PKPRKPTRPTRASKRRRLDGKRHQSNKKRLRHTSGED